MARGIILLRNAIKSGSTSNRVVDYRRNYSLRNASNNLGDYKFKSWQTPSKASDREAALGVGERLINNFNVAINLLNYSPQEND